jgi:hypothetical protein
LGRGPRLHLLERIVQGYKRLIEPVRAVAWCGE